MNLNNIQTVCSTRRFNPPLFFPDRAKSTSLAHYVVFGGFPQKASEGDDGGHAGTIEEEDGGQALQAKRVPHIAPVKWSFPLNVLHQSTKYPVMKEEKKEKSYQDIQKKSHLELNNLQRLTN